MSFSTFIAKRYLRASRKTHFFSWISALSILGISIGIAVMIVVISVFDGFETELRERFLAANAHILVSSYPKGISDYKSLQNIIKKNYGSHITGVAPFIHMDTMAKKDFLSHGVLLKGILPHERSLVQKLRGIVRPESALHELQAEIDEFKTTKQTKEVSPAILGLGLMTLMDVKLGDTVKLIVPNSKTDDAFGREELFKIVGVYDSGLQHYDNKLFITSLTEAQQIFDMQDRVHGVEIGLRNPNDSKKLVTRMQEHIPLDFNEWQSYNPTIFEAIRTERKMIALIVALVTFVASFNILTTIFVLVIQKQKDISILKALGATNRDILLIFFKQSTFMGILGGALGLALALLISFILVYIPFIDIPDVYMLSYLPVELSWKVYLGAASLGIFMSSLAGFYPALRASQILPTQGITQRRAD